LSILFGGDTLKVVAATRDETAPGDLELVRTFVNTLDLFRSDTVATTEALRAWLAERQLIGSEAAVSQADLTQAVRVREALRDLAEANAGESVPREALETLRSAAERAALRLAFTDDGRLALEPLADGVDGALAQLLEIVHRAMHAGTWARLKACRDKTCRYLYYDHSKNRSAAWCDMATCGNRNKARRRRAR
jgi:predicted RNA-binding Zn ribbon-like protein